MTSNADLSLVTKWFSVFFITVLNSSSRTPCSPSAAPSFTSRPAPSSSMPGRTFLKDGPVAQMASPSARSCSSKPSSCCSRPPFTPRISRNNESPTFDHIFGTKFVIVITYYTMTAYGINPNRICSHASIICLLISMMASASLVATRL